MIRLDVRSLAVFRIAIGLLLISDVAERFLRFELFGVKRWSVGPTWPDFIRQLLTGIAESAFAQQCFLGALLVSLIVFLIGYKTRLATVVTLVLVIFLHHFQPVILNGGDKLIRLFLFWSLFLPLGKAFSIDAWRSPLTKDEPRVAPLMISMALAAQVACPYITSALWKLASDHWIDGWGLYYSFTRDDEAKALGIWLAGMPWSVLVILNSIILIVELVGPLLLFVPNNQRLRLALVTVFISFHLGMFFTLDVGRFTFICTTGMLAMIPSLLWEKKTWISQGVWIRSPVDYLILGLTCLMVVWNISTVPGFGDFMPVTIRRAGSLVGFTQGFKMYSGVGEDGGWFTMPGKLADGTMMDFFKVGDPKPLLKERPKVISETFHSEHYRKLIERTVQTEDEPTMRNLANYHCASWNRVNPGEKRLVTFQIMFMKQKRFRSGLMTPPYPIEYYRQDCP